MKNVKPILYFIAGTVPTNDEFKAASQFMTDGPVLNFISLVDFDLNGPLLDNSGVAGAVPETYSKSKRIDIVTPPKVEDAPKAK